MNDKNETDFIESIFPPIVLRICRECTWRSVEECSICVKYYLEVRKEKGVDNILDKKKFDKEFEEKRNNFYAWVKTKWKDLPQTIKQLIIALVLIIAGSQFPWGIIGEFGSYIRAGLILGGIFMIVYKVLKPSKEKGS